MRSPEPLGNLFQVFDVNATLRYQHRDCIKPEFQRVNLPVGSPLSDRLAHFG
jgi:hypothetical protein